MIVVALLLIVYVVMKPESGPESTLCEGALSRSSSRDVKSDVSRKCCGTIRVLSSSLQ